MEYHKTVIRYYLLFTIHNSFLVFVTFSNIFDDYFNKSNFIQRIQEKKNLYYASSDIIHPVTLENLNSLCKFFKKFE